MTNRINTQLASFLGAFFFSALFISASIAPATQAASGMIA